jgi:hypothetical protein
VEDISSHKKPKVEKAKDGTQVDRVILGKNEAELLAKWVEDFNVKSEGLVKVSKADLVNHMIASHGAKLSPEEVRAIASQYYDEARWLGWSVAKMKESKKKGVCLLFDDLIKFRDEFLGKVSVFNKKKKVTAATDVSLEISKPRHIEIPNAEYSEVQKTLSENINNKE